MIITNDDNNTISNHINKNDNYNNENNNNNIVIIMIENIIYVCIHIRCSHCRNLSFVFFKTRPNLIPQSHDACSIEKPGYFLYFSVSRLGPSEPSLGPEIGSSHVIFFTEQV